MDCGNVEKVGATNMVVLPEVRRSTVEYWDRAQTKISAVAFRAASRVGGKRGSAADGTTTHTNLTGGARVVGSRHRER